MRIAYLANPDSGNGFYRAVVPMTTLGYVLGHRVRALPDGSDLTASGITDIDVLLIHRFSDDRSQRLVRAAKESGAAVVWDNDDDMGSMPKSVASHKHFSGFAWQRRLGEMQRIFRVADLVTAPSPVLAERFHAAGAPRVAVIENYIPDQFLDVERRPHPGITIGWIAGLEHQMDLEYVPVRETLQRLLEERADVNVVTIGVNLGLRHQRYRHIERERLVDLPQIAAAFDIAIAPLADLTFNHARSNIKLKEYASAGVPWLASPIGPYAGMGEKQGGRLVADDRWAEELGRLIDKPRERRKLVRHGRKWATKQTITHHVHLWESVLRQAMESET